MQPLEFIRRRFPTSYSVIVVMLILLLLALRLLFGLAGHRHCTFLGFGPGRGRGPGVPNGLYQGPRWALDLGTVRLPGHLLPDYLRGVGADQLLGNPSGHSPGNQERKSIIINGAG